LRLEERWFFYKEDDMARIMRMILGTFFLLLGFVGLFVPILQGWLFLALGILLLSVDIPMFNRLVCRIGNRFPRIGKVLSRARRFLGHKECNGENGSNTPLSRPPDSHTN
jgi:hypothetical protein